LTGAGLFSAGCMRIHADKIDNGPPHGLSARDIRLILRRGPSSWIEGLREVRLANGLNPPRAYFSRYDGRLTVYSRMGTKRDILNALLSTLAAPSLNIVNVVARRPTAPEQHRLDQFVKPLVDDLVPQVALPRGVMKLVVPCVTDSSANETA
jgi:hypothetical protein